MNSSYKIELDIFSGQQNPAFEISKEQFDNILDEINKLEESEPVKLFDGLGFRGIILYGDSKQITIQNEIIRVNTISGEKYFKGDSSIVMKSFALFKNYDKDGKYSALIEKLMPK